MKVEDVTKTLRENWGGDALEGLDSTPALNRSEWTTIKGVQEQAKSLGPTSKVYAVTKRAEDEYSFESFKIE